MVELDGPGEEGKMGPGTEGFSNLANESGVETAEADERNRAKIFEEHGSEITADELDEKAEARQINADALFADGLPDKAEVEGDVAARLRGQAAFLRKNLES